MRRRQVRAQPASFLSPQNLPEDAFQWWREEWERVAWLTLGFQQRISLLLLSCCVCVHAQLLSHVSLCSPVDCSPAGSLSLGFSQARILEWVVMPSSRRSSQHRDQTHLSCVSCIAGRFFTTEPPVKWKSLSRDWLCHPMDHIVHGILQARILEWVVGSLSLLQGIFPTQGSNPGLPHCRQILYQLSHKGSPRILEWVVFPFSSGSSLPRNRTGVSCIAGRFSTSWATWEAHLGLVFWQGSWCEYLKVLNNGKQGNWSHWCFITTVLSGHVEGIRGGKPGDMVLGR